MRDAHGVVEVEMKNSPTTTSQPDGSAIAIQDATDYNVCYGFVNLNA